MDKRMQITGLGALNMDNIYQVERLLADGETAIKSSGSFPGGSAANTIYGLAKLGIQSGFSGTVGDDNCGRQLISDFKKAGTDTSRLIIKSGTESGAVFCLSSASRRSLYILPGANSHLILEDIDMRYVNTAQCLHLASFVDDSQFTISKKVVQQLNQDVKLSFSPGALYAARGLKALTPILKRTDILFINRSEIEKLTGIDFIDGVDVCMKLGCRMVVVTLGKGLKRQTTRAVAYIRNEQAAHWTSSGRNLKADGISDTTGAGDAFSTGFLYGVLKAKTIESCGKLGNSVAQLKLKYPGARQGLPTKEQLEAHYRQLYNENP